MRAKFGILGLIVSLALTSGSAHGSDTGELCSLVKNDPISSGGSLVTFEQVAGEYISTTTGARMCPVETRFETYDMSVCDISCVVWDGIDWAESIRRCGQYRPLGDKT